MLKIQEGCTTFKFNANFGLKNGNLNLIEPICNRKIMTQVTKVFVNLFFTVKFHYYVFPVVMFNEIRRKVFNSTHEANHGTAAFCGHS